MTLLHLKYQKRLLVSAESHCHRQKTVSLEPENGDGHEAADQRDDEEDQNEHEGLNQGGGGGGGKAAGWA